MKKGQFSLHSSDLLEPGNSYLGKSVIKASGLTSVLSRHIFVLFNRYGRPKIEPKFFRTRFVKRS